MNTKGIRLGERVFVAAVAVGILLGLGASSASAQDPAEYDHLKCYSIRDLREETHTFTLEQLLPNGFPPNTVVENCKSAHRIARELCLDVKKSNVQPPPAGGVSALGPVPNAWKYLCYKLKCDKASKVPPDSGVLVRDQFGERLVRLGKVRRFCTPILDIQPLP